MTITANNLYSVYKLATPGVPPCTPRVIASKPSPSGLTLMTTTYPHRLYLSGETWQEDICTECTCSSTPSATGEYETSCTAFKCPSCSSGYTYVPVAGQCCGDCVPTVCHFEGRQYHPGQTWVATGRYGLLVH